MKILLKPCADCEFADVERVERTWWMRALPGIRHYYCGRCQSTLLARKEQVESRQWMTTTAKHHVKPAPHEEGTQG